MSETNKICGNCKWWNGQGGIGKCVLSRHPSKSFPLSKKMHSNCGLSTTMDFGCTEFTKKQK